MSYAVDWPNAEYHEIVPRLFQGGHLWREAFRDKSAKHSSISGDPSWDYVVSCYLDLESEKSFPQCDMRLVLFDDTQKGLSEQVWEKIKSVVDEAVMRWIMGEKILIRCQAGYNRSGLVMCLVLMNLGFTAEEAIKLVRERRGKDVLVNGVFEQYVHAREEEYHRPMMKPIMEEALEKRTA